jgi:hypothetical protein
MALIHHNPRFTFVACNGVKGVLDLQMFCRDDDRLVALVSELIHEDGTYAVDGAHITLGVEQIATKITTDLGLAFDYLIIHYPTHDGYFTHRPSQALDETFDLMPLQWDSSTHAFKVAPTPESWHWKHIDRKTAEAIIGEPFQDTFVSGTVSVE